ncbi:MAG: YdcF family protein [Chloroflexi bacterium]|nr:YdcF family protein [Chloroflexota bacterium]MCC6893930.1 YdcF family protein [Anaerolineae bacterium]
MRLIRFVWRRKVTLILVSMVVGIASAIMLVTVRAYSAERAKGQIYTLDTAPSYPVAIIFGALVTRSGRPSAMLADRIKMGVELYNAGKVKALLLTGDNSVETYNEPEAMRQYALSLGMPDSALVLDYAGFRTYDSCYRARDIFKVDRAILVTQAFHLDRALLTCSSLGIESVGVAADVMRPIGYARSAIMTSQMRELPSTAMALFDIISGRKPTFLGEALPIFE